MEVAGKALEGHVQVSRRGAGADGKAESVRKPPYLRLVKNNLVC